MAVETSCDETAVAILAGKDELLASEIASQAGVHQAFGGIVPEVASRNHLTHLKPLIERALKKSGLDIGDMDAFAATAGPGLATSLMLGAASAKALAVSLHKPFIAVNHIEGHLISPFFGSREEIVPCVALIVSGGHTLLVNVAGFQQYRIIGQTRDDAAGEAFDKVAKLLGLPYPGGPQIDRLAAGGDPARFDFPRSMIHSDDFGFSFSGLKTAVRYMLPRLHGERMEDICASVQEAIVDVLVHKTVAAAKASGRSLVTVSGGVSCNSRLRTKFRDACELNRLQLRLAEPALCTDNAAMIALVAAHQHARCHFTPLDADIDPNLRLVAVQ
jgi:N6-L-threonylcarbamoyladenine synthase